jgi:hypothetical protein
MGSTQRILTAARKTKARGTARKAVGGPKRTPQDITDIKVIAGGRDII